MKKDYSQYYYWLSPLVLSSTLTFILGIYGLFQYNLKLGYLFSYVSFALTVLGILLDLFLKYALRLSFILIVFIEIVTILFAMYLLNII